MLDLGTGGGIPGLVLASELPNAHVVLLDGRTERARMVSGFVERLGWQDRVEVVADRAENAGRGSLRGTVDLVVARGFGPPGVTAECAAPFLRPGGLLVVSEPPAAPDGQLVDRWPTGPCAQLGLVRGSTPTLRWSFAMLQAVGSCPERFPRRVGIPAKRPLF